MKKFNFIITIILILFFINPAFAQPGIDDKKSQRHEKIETFRVSFLSAKLELTPEEAQVFWPVYNQFQKDMKSLHQQRRQKWQNNEGSFDEMSDKEITTLIDNNIKYEQQELDIRKKYHQQFKTILSPRKVALLYEGEREFKIMLINKLREQKENRN